MLQGFYRAAVHEAGHLGSTPEERDAPYLEAIREGRIMDFLGSLPKSAEARTQNATIQMLPAWLMYLVFGAPVTNGEMSSQGTDCGHRGVGLSSESSEPTYTEYSTVSGYTGFNTWLSGQNMATGSSETLWRQALVDNVEPYRVWTDEGGREGYYFRFRVIWLPSDGLITDIRGALSCFGGSPDVEAPAARYTGCGRTRFKDSGGNPVTLAKTASQSFFLEHLVKLFTR